MEAVIEAVTSAFDVPTELVVTAELVRSTRAARKQSRRVVAELAGLTEGKVWSIENGRHITDEEAAGIRAWLESAETTYVLREAPPKPVTHAAATPAAPATGESMGGVLLADVAFAGTPGTSVDEALAASGPIISPEAEALLDSDDRLFSNSEVQTFKRCRRKWWLGWYRGLRPQGPDSPVGPRAVGDRGHRALAQWYVPDGTPRTDPRDALERLITDDWTTLVHDYGQHHGDEVPPDLEKKFVQDADLERVMLDGYVQWLAESGDDADLEVIAPETVLARRIMRLDRYAGKAVHFIGRLDARVRRRSDGAHQFIDHKFVAELTTPTRILPLDEQMLGYHVLEEDNAPNGTHVSGALYNMLRRVKRTGNAKPPFYLRVFVGHNKYETGSFRVRSEATMKNILEVESRLSNGASHLEEAYPTPTRDCAWQCPFFAVCGMFDDGSRAEAMLEAVYKKGDPRDYYRTEVTQTRNEE